MHTYIHNVHAHALTHVSMRLSHTYIRTYMHIRTHYVAHVCVCVCVCVCVWGGTLRPANCEMNRYPWSKLVAIKHSCAWQTLTIQK